MCISYAHVQGTCDTSTGLCVCNPGFGGTACETSSTFCLCITLQILPMPYCARTSCVVMQCCVLLLSPPILRAMGTGDVCQWLKSQTTLMTSLHTYASDAEQSCYACHSQITIISANARVHSCLCMFTDQDHLRPVGCILDIWLRMRWRIHRLWLQRTYLHFWLWCPRRREFFSEHYPFFSCLRAGCICSKIVCH